jgi:hypothetical protein
LGSRRSLNLRIGIRAESREAALAEMKAQFPDYIFLGSWAAAQAK